MGIIKPKYLILAVVLCTVALLSSIPAIYLLYLVDEGKSSRLGDAKPNENNVSLIRSGVASDPLAKERVKMHIENKRAKASEKTVSLLFQLTTEIVVLPTFLLETAESTDIIGSSNDTNSTETQNSTLSTTVKTKTVDDDGNYGDDEEPETPGKRTIVWSKKVKKRSGKRKKRNKKTKKRYNKSEINLSTCADIQKK